MKQKPSLSQWILQQPVVWGGLSCLGFYAVAGKSTLNHPLVNRYFESHPVEYITTFLFFVGLAALVLKAIQLILQHAAMGRPLLEQQPEGGQPTEESARMLDQLAREPAHLQDSYLIGRLREALLYVRRKGSADTLDTHLQYLADNDAGKMHASYAVVRLVIWAIPILGFLGTVIGITLAIARLSAEQLNQSLELVVSGLSVAFDTTALALALSIVLMFAKYVVERIETRLLARVDARTSSDLVGRFHQYGTTTDPYAASVRRLGEALENATEKLTQKQAEIWRETIDAAHQQWAQLTTAAGELLEAAVAESLTNGLKHHAEALTSGLQQHTDALDEGLAKHSALLTKEIEQVATSLRTVTEDFRAAVVESTNRHADALTMSIDRHGDLLASSTSGHVELLAESVSGHGELLAKSVSGHGELLAKSTGGHGDALRESLADHTTTLSETARHYADSLTEALGEQTSTMRQIAEGTQDAFLSLSGKVERQQTELVRQGEILLKVVDATGQVRKLEEALNGNLAALAGAGNFEETATSLAAAVQLLAARLGQSSSDPTRGPVQLAEDGKQDNLEQAAA